MPALPVVTVKRPAILAGQANGKLDLDILVSTPGQAGGPTVWLVAPAARAWRAMCAAARADGHVLKATSLTDSYRPYDDQRRIFVARYTRTFLEDRPVKRWDSDNNGSTEIWYQRPGTAQAAVPGTSNHGWGLAVDIGEERDGDSGVESIDDATLAWLIAHADEFGFSAEVQDERWHWRYFAGDNIPAAVLAFEQGDDDVSDALDLLVTRHRPGVAPQNQTRPVTVDGQVISISTAFAIGDIEEILAWSKRSVARLAQAQAELTALRGVVETLAEAIRNGGGTVDTAAILAGVDQRLAAQRAAIEADTRDAVADGMEAGANAVRTDA